MDQRQPVYLPGHHQDSRHRLGAVVACSKPSFWQRWSGYNRTRGYYELGYPGMSLRGRTAVVTGASTGLGLAIAGRLPLTGSNVAICARDSKLLFEARDQIAETTGARVFAHPCDVGSESAVNDFIARTLSEFAQVDILINNAGVLGPIGKLEDTTFDQWRQTIETNLYSVFLYFARLCRSTHAPQELRQDYQPLWWWRCFASALLWSVCVFEGRRRSPHRKPGCRAYGNWY